MTQISLRPASLDDLEDVARVRTAIDVAVIGKPFMNVDDFRDQMTSPDLELSRDWVVALDAIGRVAGSGTVWPAMDGPAFIDNGVHPDSRGIGIGGALMDWAEARAMQSGGGPVAVRTAIWLGERSAERFVEARRFRPVRFQQALAGEFKEAPPEPRWPVGIACRTMNSPGDDRAMHGMHAEAYEDHWGDSEWDTFENFRHLLIEDETFDPSLVFLAVDGGRIVGDAVMLTGTADNPEGAFLTDLAVLREYRGRGIGTALLHEAIREVHGRGLRLVTSMVDSQSLTGADRIYERIGLLPTYGYTIYERTIETSRATSSSA
ncbi:MAG: GNAT family N-acetyltransferase [Actinomycetota bacterium]